MSVDDVGRRIMARIAETSPELFARDPNYRYYECSVCRAQFIWTTERMGDGKFCSAIYAPTGKGSRSGRPEQLKATREVHHRKRKDAKARAYRLYEKHTGGGDSIAEAAHNHDRARSEGT